MPPVVDEILNILRTEDNFLVAGHATPDGDAYGSAVAVCFLLKTLGKRFVHYAANGTPPSMDWLGHPDMAHTSLDGFTPGWSIVLDSGDISRLDPEAAAAVVPEHTVNIDHHLGNSQFGALNWVDPSEPAVGTMVAQLARRLDIPLAGDLGEAVYLAIVSDTGHFSYGNTRPETLELAAEIVRLGLDLGAFNAKLEKSWTPQRLQLWSHALGESVLHCDGKIGMVRIRKDILEQTHSTRYDCDGLVEIMRRVKSVRIAVSLRETEDGVKVSLRSHGDDNVQQVAQRLGGGGHKNASGATVHGTMDEAEQLIVRYGSEILGLGCPADDCTRISNSAMAPSEAS
ncbi:DHH family phosphoesterase [Oceanidesulfovibrio marinus]|uniref:Bifunctional oligoribonuclease/PAP phosphatase NrnA n=1 Tax=Oceanidesulfovibrio marinus TaxID=370038 RepID=A0ABX6NLN2_9BACT|nr:bifunctional oligoribonuclease/PAP phosphatase NrnA [Oceanidesulfovibrio marinus]QJT10602.1 bifunctional oligoribonuclease/PAP phosphatase NrnA [Oceanidesulfovibrio marinus]